VANAIWFTWPGSRTRCTPAAIRELFGEFEVTNEKITSAFEKTTVYTVQGVYRCFLTDCPDAIWLARRLPHRIREKDESYLSDDLTAELFAHERIDLKGAIVKVRELGD
jgi:hypothetical protein